MNLDLALLALTALLGALGAYTGAIKQLSQWIGLAAAYLLGKPLAAALAPLLAPRLPLPASLAPAVAALVLLPLLYFGVGRGSLWALKRLLAGREKTRGDRVAGFAMGSGKAAALSFLCLSLVFAFEEPLTSAGWDLPGLAADSRAAAFARAHNLFSVVALPQLEQAKKMAAARSDPQAALALLNDPSLQGMMSDPGIKALMQDPALKAMLADPGALQRGELPAGVTALMDNPEVKKLLEDPEIAKKLAELQGPK